MCVPEVTISLLQYLKTGGSCLFSCTSVYLAVVQNDVTPDDCIYSLLILGEALNAVWSGCCSQIVDALGISPVDQYLMEAFLRATDRLQEHLII